MVVCSLVAPYSQRFAAPKAFASAALIFIISKLFCFYTKYVASVFEQLALTGSVG